MYTYNLMAPRGYIGDPGPSEWEVFGLGAEKTAEEKVVPWLWAALGVMVLGACLVNSAKARSR